MKSRHFSMLLVSAALVAGFAPVAASNAFARDPGAPPDMAAYEASASHHDAYLQSTRDEVRVWRVRLDKFADSATAKSQDARKAAAADLDKAWSKTSDAAARLETASAADWRSAKASFKKSSDELAAVWSKTVAETK